MITPMKKATVLCLAHSCEKTVEALRELGLFHVVPGPVRSGAAAGRPESGAPGSEREGFASSAEAHEARERAARAQRLLEECRKSAAQPTDGDGACPQDAAALVGRALALDAERDAQAKRLLALRAEEEAQAALGDFDPAQARALAGKGVRLTLYRVPKKEAAGRAWPGTALGESARHRLFAAVSLGDGAALPEGAEAVPLPERSLSAVRADIAEAESARAAAETELVALAPQAETLTAHIASLDETAAYLKVVESLAAHGAVASLDGFLPAARVPELREAAQKAGWALWIRDPAPDEKVPVALTLPRWLRPIEVLFHGLGILPGYREVDVSAVFLFFFSIFFAMIVGDAGYGALLLLAVLALRKRFPKASSKPFWLFGTFGVATVVWGALTGAWFGIGPEHLPPWMRGVEWLQADGNVMWLCFLIGAVHLTIANLWNALVLWPSRKALAQVGWALMNWTMFFAAAQLVTGRPFPAFAGALGGVGLVLIVVFMLDKSEIKTEWINYPMLALNLVSALVDVMSYIRLFAVGMASAKIALNFNQMAAGLAMPVWLKPLPMLLILLLGHGLNLVLGALSVLVHAVRLNTLEFSTHVGLTWAGEPYRPFAKG